MAQPTRRAKLSACSKLGEFVDLEGKSSEEDGYDGGYDGETNEEEASTREDTQSIGNTRKESNLAPAKKRAKKGAKNTLRAKKAVRHRKDLSLLPTMPLDILFEIFALLNPKDMVTLSRTSKLFRQTVLSKNAITIWKRVLKNSDLPECPTYLTEPKWAALVFGNTCQICNATNIQKVDFGLRRRVCTGCKRKNLVAEVKLKHEYPELEESVLDMIPHTNVGGWADGHATKSRFFWRDDIDDMMKKLAEHQHGVYMGRPNARKKLQEFISQQKDLVKEVLSNVNKHQSYMNSVIEERELAGLEVMTRRGNAIRQRFVDLGLGYTESDVDACRSHEEFTQRRDLSERIWIRIRPLLEPLVREKKIFRLIAESGRLRATRRTIVERLYDEYKRTIRPSQWLHLPRTYRICQFPPFAKVINLPDNVPPVTPESFDEAMQALPQLLSKHTNGKMASRVRKLPASANSFEYTGSRSIDRLDLATSVFRCRSNTTLGTIVVGTEGHMIHTCMSQGHGLPGYWYWPSEGGECLSFSTEGSENARLLVGLAGLDANTATVSDMDQCGVRFSCSSCPVHDLDGVSMRFGYSWRAAILHALRNDHSAPGCSWGVLSNIDTASMKLVEDRDLEARHVIARWTCNQCPHNLNRRQARSVIVEHLRDVHQISTPNEPEDLFFYDRQLSGPAKVLFRVDRPRSVKRVS